MHDPDLVIPYQGRLLAGVDEAGRGPLAGSVVAAAVILDPEQPIEGLADSKRLSEKKRQSLALEIKDKALSYAIAHSSVAEIDQLNILQASLLAMKRAVEQLDTAAEFVLVDGNRLPDWDYAAKAVVKGDARVAAIAAASILAKVARDEEMLELEQRFPGYGFAKHKAYPTKQHFEALRRLGATSEHRKSFKPVQKVLSGDYD